MHFQNLAFLIEKDLNIDSIQLAQIILGHFTELYEDFQNGRHKCLLVEKIRDNFKNYLSFNLRFPNSLMWT